MSLPDWFWVFPDYVFWLLGYEENMNIKQQYLAFALDPASRAALLSQFKPKFSRVICEHITVEFNLTDETSVVLTEELQNADIQVVGYQSGDGVECLVCSVNGSIKRPDGKIYHITLSLGSGHKPVESNQLLQQQGYQSCLDVPIHADLQLLAK